MEVVVDDEVGSADGSDVGVEVNLKSSTDIQDGNRNLLQSIEMKMAPIRENVIKMMRTPTESARVRVKRVPAEFPACPGHASSRQLAMVRVLKRFTFVGT
ncbi:hypothetical protein RB195_012142 [Necator americanus]|uniref:Uncharacterized protein n=1 Tax=Necator americanus TaxID=51031 RepID=A0ABR1D5N9_NECAM